MSKEQLSLIPIGFPIPQNNSDQLPYNLSKAVFLRRQISNYSLQKVYIENASNNFNGQCKFDDLTKLKLCELSNYQDIKYCLYLSSKAFTSIKFSEKYIIDTDKKELMFGSLISQLFDNYKNSLNLAKPRHCSHNIVVNALAIISTPNYVLTLRLKKDETYNGFLKWLHGDNRTI